MAIAIAVIAPYAAWAVWGQGLTFTAFMATGAGLATAAASGFASGMVGSGGDLRAGLIGAATAVGAWGIGTAFGEAASFGKVIAHGVNGGLSTMAQGGKFAHGFLSSGFTEAFAPDIRGKFNTTAGQVAMASIVGGTASAIGGGKFANGAVTGAFSYAFNSAAHAAAGPPGRTLTANEIGEAQSVFGSKIDYLQVRVIDGKYIFTQGSGYVMAPDGNIYWPGGCSDLATCGGGGSVSTFIHEMTHVMQHQHGVNVLGQGALLQAAKFASFGLYDPYKVTYDPNRSFRSYNIEQQGRIAEGIYSGLYRNNIDY